MIKSTAKKIYLFLIFVLLYAPIITLMVLSFNNTKTRSKWNGFTGKWYLQLFQNKDIMNALYTTLIIAFLSALIATLIGTAAALGINAYKSTYITSRSHKYSDAQRRYCNRNFSHAPFHCMSVYTWIFHNIASTYYI